MSRFALACLVGLTLNAAPAYAQDAEPEEDPGLPRVDIYMASIDWSTGTPRLGQPVNVTARPGYDNQPAFLPDGSGFYFSSGDDNGETDIWRCNLDCSTRWQITDTPTESEFTPRPTPAGDAISYIHQAPGEYGGQVWLDAPGGGVAHAASEHGPFGYYAWNNDMTRAVTFALTEPFQLHVVDRFSDQGPQAMIDNIGRALYPAPGHESAYFTIPRASEGFSVMNFGFENYSIRPMFDLPGATQDYAVFAFSDGSHGFFAVADGVLHFRTVENDWLASTDLGAFGLTGITRLAVSPDLSLVAIVAEDG
ncbi:TolB family protein [Maricaulis sp. CAU 1757]